MSEKIVSGGLLFTAVSLFTYKFLNSANREKKEKYNPDKLMEHLETIFENHEQEHNKPVTPSNTPNSEPERLTLKKILDNCGSNDLLVTNDLLINDGDKGDQTQTFTMSSFLELEGDQTDTEELEFTTINSKLDLFKPRLQLLKDEEPSKETKSEEIYTYDEKSDDVEYSYYSESSLIELEKKEKKKSRKRKGIFRRRTL